MPTQGYGNLDGWFDALSSSRPVPAVGAATALSAAMAASVLAKVARRSRDHMADAADHVADAEHLRDSLLALAQEDGPSFRRAMTLSHAGDPNAMSIASAVPWRVAVVSADVGVLGVIPTSTTTRMGRRPLRRRVPGSPPILCAPTSVEARLSTRARAWRDMRRTLSRNDWLRIRKPLRIASNIFRMYQYGCCYITLEGGSSRPS